MRNPKDYHARQERKQVKAGTRYSVRVTYETANGPVIAETRRMPWRKASEIFGDFHARQMVIACVVWDHKFNRKAMG